MAELHASTWDYLSPNADELVVMARLREAAATYAAAITANLPDSADRTYALRKLRAVAMWCNVAVVRNPDGSPRTPTRDPEPDEPPREPHDSTRYDSSQVTRSGYVARHA